MKRRTFLKAAGSAGLATVLARPARALPPDDPYMKNIGLQLYTLRNQLAADLPGTMKAVADAGYRQVELMNALEAAPVLEAAKEVGLEATSTFLDWRTLVTPGAEGVPSFEATLEATVKHGFRYLVFGYVAKGHRETADQFKTLADRANRAGQACRAAGVQLCYHHHSFEFAPLPGGKTGWEIFVERLDPKLVPFELDVFWVAIGGKDPVETINGLKGRIAQLHLKDIKADVGTIHDEGKVPAEAFQEVGDGAVDWPAVIRAAREAGVAQCHVEQDQSPDAIASIGQSMRYLKKLRA